ncbi:VOC family protein [Marinilactibacillus sp. Marseille-P9653]|uniref:VOC family protein n=1 Tax=Marinilactibacillus sp. Marseille-P9653 TaxID=2866583 RepID=UPI001CE45B51|nr:VOC family protein [Marinilactibacillus sp. Marseille-P9653]
MNTSYKIEQTASIGSVTLKVKDLNRISEYYQELGLTVIEAAEDKVSLGVSGSDQPLLVLKTIQNAVDRRAAGLFHTAFLLPSRKDLGDTLYRLLVKKIPIDGASDHGYSEAIYLQDPEGNGIEIYRDKPKSEWDIREDGRIAGITIEMDADGVIESRDQSGTVEKFPENTTIGHIHLSIIDLDETQAFYQQLGFDLTDQFGDQARFFSAGGYHHHIGTNIWMGKNLPKLSEEDLGLESYSVLLSSEESLEKLKQIIELRGILVLEDTHEVLSVLDPNGIKVIFELRR